MSEQTSYRCDICKVEKQETNHWYKGYHRSSASDLNGIMIVSWNTNKITAGVTLELGKPDAHLCG